MSDEQTDPAQDLARRISESIVNSPAMENFRRQIAEFAATQTAPLNEAVRHFNAAHQERFARQYTRIRAPAIEAGTNRLAQAVASFAEGMRTRYSDIDTGFRLDMSRLDIDAVLTSPFDALPADQREWARRAVDEATAHVDTAELVDQVPDEMLDSLTDSARTFASAQPGGLSRAAQKKLFIGFVVTVFFLLLLQAQIESDAVKEFVEDAGGAMLVVTPTALGAAYVWDKLNPGPDDEDEADENH
ncbi:MULTISPECIES: hypothetical protein [unclassified Streptomyces]|uniref:hypothetical protein n=1 Tax=unclassified Streptomyces TaxID=2593676 RepID=UPI0004CABED5|nr:MULTISPECIES: hypothetical protein [unclassified Streptomyces]KOV95425.1 hypothetical protein ADL02_09525 [Streptomyces sp. NRRL WC-3723]